MHIAARHVEAIEPTSIWEAIAGLVAFVVGNYLTWVCG